MDFSKYWMDIVHYGVSGLMALIGAIYALGGHIPGVHVDNPKTLVATGVGVFVAGLKGGWVSSK